MIRRLLLLLMLLPSFCGYCQADHGYSNAPDSKSEPNKKSCKTKYQKSVEKIKIDSSGVISLDITHIKSGLSRNELVTAYVDTSILEIWNQNVLSAAKDSIKKSIDSLIKIFNGDNRAYMLYSTGVAKQNGFSTFEQDLKTISSGLSNKPYDIANTIDKTSILYQLHHQCEIVFGIKSDLRYYKIESKKGRDAYTLTVTKTDPYKQFLIDYYNAVVSLDINKSILDLGKEDFEPLHTSVSQNISNIKKMLYSIKSRKITVFTLDSMYDVYNDAQMAVNTATDKVNQYRKLPWMWQWLWFTGGNLRSLPFGFTDEKLLPLKYNVDVNARNKMKNYINLLDEKYQNDTSEKDAMKYKTMVLDMMSKADTMFVDSTVAKKKQADNRKLKDNFLAVTRTLNSIKIGHTNKSYADYFAYSTLDTLSVIKVQSKNPLVVDRSYLVTIHNLPSGAIGKLNKTSNPFKDISPISDALNRGISSIVDVTALGGTAGAINLTGILNSGLNTNPTPHFLSPASFGDANFDPNKVANGHFDRASLKTRSIKPEEWKQITKSLKEMHSKFVTDNEYEFTKLPKVKELPFSKEFIKIAKVTYENIIVVNGNEDAQLGKILSELRTSYKDYLIEHGIRQIAVIKLNKTSTVLGGLTNDLNNLIPPMPKLTPTSKPDPDFHSEIFGTDVIDSATKWKYDVAVVTPKPDAKSDPKFDTTKIATFTFKTGKRYRLMTSIGLTYTFMPTTQNTVTTTNNVVSISSKREQYGVAASLHYYPYKGVFLQDKFVFGKTWDEAKTRFNIMLGLDFRKVPDNIYFGLGYDLGPGIQICTGLHFYKYTKYEIKNDQIANQANIYKVTGPFLLIGIDPGAFVKAINIFK